MVRDASDVLALLLEGGRTTVAGRLAGTFRNIGRNRIADDIVKTMQTAGYDIREKDPFDQRDDYMDALESGSVKQDIVPFAVFLGRLVSERLEGKQLLPSPTIIRHTAGF